MNNLYDALILLRTEETINLGCKLICKTYGFIQEEEYVVPMHTCIYYSIGFKSIDPDDVIIMNQFIIELFHYSELDKNKDLFFEIKCSGPTSVIMSWRISKY